MSKLEVFLLGMALVNVLAVLELVRRRKLQEGFALLWLAVGAGSLAMVVLRSVVDRFARAVGIGYGANLFLALGIQFLLFVCMALSLQVSRLDGRMERLAEEVAFLRGARAPAAGSSGELPDESPAPHAAP